MPTPSRAASSPSPLSGAARPFLAQIGLQLGMPPGALQALEAGEAFVGPSGLLCRVHAGIADGGWFGYPEVLLPLAAAELGGQDVLRLLGVQEQLLGGEGWHLGLMEGGGLLALRPLQAQRDAARVAADLGRGHVLARAALDVLVPAQDTAPVPDDPDGPSAAGPDAGAGAGAAP